MSEMRWSSAASPTPNTIPSVLQYAILLRNLRIVNVEREGRGDE